MSIRIHVIANPAAGQPQPLLHTLNSIFHPAGADWELMVTKRGGDAHNFARQAVEQGADVVAAYGGDGTVMEVASALIGSGVPLAILPGGTANVVSVEMSIPKALEEATNLILSESRRLQAMDIGKAGERHFLHRVGIGMAAEKVVGATRELKDRYGAFAYTMAWLQNASNPPKAHYSLTLDGKKHEMEGISCIIANSGNMGMAGIKMAKDVSISDGMLDVFVIRNIGFRMAASAAAGIASLVDSTDTIHHWQCREATIVADPPQLTQGDGEVWQDTPITVTVLPQAVQVIVPGH